MGLKTAFEALGLDARPRYDDEGNPQEGANDCLAIQHYDQNRADPDDEWGQMIPVMEQKYYVGGKQYMVSHIHFHCVYRYDSLHLRTRLTRYSRQQLRIMSLLSTTVEH